MSALARVWAIVYAAATMRHKLSTSPVFSRILLGAGLLMSSACAPKLGDGCERASECSVNLDRTCDLSQPGGYCTIPDCSANNCPEDGVCVRFQPDEPRLARSWCMAECGNTRDCDRDDYVCRSAEQINQEARMADAKAPKIADVLDDKASRKFCVVKQQD